jgi:hypothetical protein
MSERARLLEILYVEVMDASKLSESTKGGPAETHRAALAALSKAVERYTDFSMDGKVPQDLQDRIPTASGGQSG